MVKKFTIPFASQGDANDIPDALQVDGKVSFTQGFSYDYERPYDDPQAKDIAREDMNGIFKAITSAVGELQTLGASEWSSAISYPKGAIVYYEKDLYISQVDDNQNTPPQNWVSITSIANDSLKKAANLSDLTNKATARNNLGLGSSATLNKTDVIGTSTSLVATQKLVNDTKINLDNSKQDKLTFSGTGNVARMSEVNKKRDLSDFSFADSNGAVFLELGSPETSPKIQVAIANNNIEGAFYFHDRVTKNSIYLPITSKDGTLALTSDIPTVSQSTGSSTTSVMSQKAVTDQLNSIKNSHGLGYGQRWVDVTSQRVAGTTYTNNTGKPIYVIVTTKPNINTFPAFTIDNITVQVGNSGPAYGVMSISPFIIPINSTYKCSGPLMAWIELR